MRGTQFDRNYDRRSILTLPVNTLVVFVVVVSSAATNLNLRRLIIIIDYHSSLYLLLKLKHCKTLTQ